MSSPSTTEAVSNTAAEAAQTGAAAATTTHSSASNEAQASEVHVEGILHASHWVAQEAPDVISLLIARHDVLGFS